MGVLANLKIRTKVLIALLPLVIMVIAAALFASVEMRNIDTWYTELIDRNIKALQNLTMATALNDRFGQLLYKEIAEPDPDRMRVIDAEIDQLIAEFHSALDEARRHRPARAPAINAVAGLFDEAVAVIAQVLDVELIKILELLPGDAELLLRSGIGWNPGVVGVAHVSTSRETQAGYTLASGGPVVVDNLATETRFTGAPTIGSTPPTVSARMRRSTWRMAS